VSLLLLSGIGLVAPSPNRLCKLGSSVFVQESITTVAGPGGGASGAKTQTGRNLRARRIRLGSVAPRLQQ
jgi:hypothetical protein